MLIHIKNFAGIREADIELTNFALVAGANAAGKSSIAMAAAVALTGLAVPPGIRKTDAGVIVRAGQSKGSVLITVDQPQGGGVAETSSLQVSYPAAKVESNGPSPARASVYAVGLRTLVGLDPKESAPVLLEYLKAMPSDDDVRAECKRIGLSDDVATTLITRLKEQGFDNVHAKAKERGIAMKGQWEQLAGERYGSDKAQKWLPTHWETDLSSASEESLSAQLTQAREFVEAAIATSAVDEDERRRYKEAADSLDDRVTKLNAQAEQLQKSRRILKETRDAHDALPRPSAQEKTVDCPHCGKHVVIVAGSLRKPVAHDAKEDANRQAAINEASAALDALTAAADADAKEFDRQGEDVRKCRAAAEMLKKMGDGATSAAELERVREAATLAERRLKAFTVKRDADSLADSIAMNAKIVEMLRPEGLRLTKLRDAIKGYNAKLAELSDLAGWHRVEIAEDCTVMYGGRSTLLSASEKYRMSATLQARMAQDDGSDAVVFDAADVLDGAGRNGLVKIALHLPIPSLICMTLKRDQVPNVGPIGGVAYWLEEGEAKRI